MLNNCVFLLTCATKAEADTIASVLLRQKLIACAKQLPVGSDFLWKNEVDHNDEVLIMMDSRVDLFEAAEAEIKKHHSYETFVLQALPILKTSDDAQNWLNESLA